MRMGMRVGDGEEGEEVFIEEKRLVMMVMRRGDSESEELVLSSSPDTLLPTKDK